MKKTNMIKLLGTGVIMLSMVTGCGNGQSAQKYTSLVTLDVNPSIQLHLDEDDKVIEAIAVNDDAKKVLQDMELEQADANVAMNAVLGSLVKNGYLNANQNTVLLSVENDDDQARVALEDELSQYIYTTLKSYSIEGAIYSQDIDIDDDVESLMNKYSISYGKANLIEDIIDENDDAKKTYKVEDLVKLNAQDLILIYQSLDKDDTQKNANKMVGNVSTKQYITKDEALNIALKNASVSKSQIKELEIDYDMENGVLTYDIEFKYNQNEYEYEVSAAMIIQTIIQQVNQQHPNHQLHHKQVKTQIMIIQIMIIRIMMIIRIISQQINLLLQNHQHNHQVQDNQQIKIQIMTIQTMIIQIMTKMMMIQIMTKMMMMIQIMTKMMMIQITMID